MADMQSVLQHEVGKRWGKPRGYVRVEFRSPAEAKEVALAMAHAEPSMRAHVGTQGKVVIFRYGDWLADRGGVKMPRDPWADLHAEQHRSARRIGPRGRGGKGRRAPTDARQRAALAALGRAIRRARGGYSQEVHDAQDACYDDARIPAADVNAYEDRVRRGLLESRDPATRRQTHAFARQQADLAAAIMKLTR